MCSGTGLWDSAWVGGTPGFKSNLVMAMLNPVQLVGVAQGEIRVCPGPLGMLCAHTYTYRNHLAAKQVKCTRLYERFASACVSSHLDFGSYSLKWQLAVKDSGFIVFTSSISNIAWFI